MSGNLSELEAVLEHRFGDRSLLECALTHKSRAYEHGSASSPDNERLEFLGDSILGFVASDHLVRLHPDHAEGPLSKRKAHYVSADRLCEAARRIDLGKYLLLGRGEELSGGRNKKALLADAMEAVIAAIYLDGGLAPAKSFVERWILTGDEPVDPVAPHPTDPKSALQELAQARKLPQPRYTTLSTSGPEHQKTFSMEVRVGDLAGLGEGNSKKSASQRAAEDLLARISRDAAAETSA